VGLRSIYWLLRKEVLLDARDPLLLYSRSILSLSLAVAGGIVASTGLWGPEPLLPALTVALLLFQGVLSSYSAYLREAEAGALDALRLSRVSPSEVYTAKTAYSAAAIWVQTAAFQAAYMALAGAPPASAAPQLAAWTLAASLMVASVSSLSSAMLVYSSHAAALAPTLIAALTAPYLLAAAPHLNAIAQGVSPPPGWHYEALIPPAAFYLVALALVRALEEA
jgi:ABC-type transport system involved in cytochrome c biogenesis permease component